MRILFLVFALIAGVTVGIEAAGPWANRVYLATYPCSGNHWMRYLIEEATHIATSSVYQDPDPWHLREAFPWGGYCAPHGYEGGCRYPFAGEPVVVKTHYPALVLKQGDLKLSKHTIRVVRHPVDSFYSWYARKCRRLNKPTQEIVPHDLVVKMINQWRNFQKYWDEQPDVYTIRYEDMLANPREYLKNSLDIIGQPYTEADLERALLKHPPFGHELKHLSHFTEEDLHIIRRDLPGLMRKYKYTIPKSQKNFSTAVRVSSKEVW